MVVTRLQVSVVCGGKKAQGGGREKVSGREYTQGSTHGIQSRCLFSPTIPSVYLDICCISRFQATAIPSSAKAKYIESTNLKGGQFGKKNYEICGKWGLGNQKHINSDAVGYGPTSATAEVHTRPTLEERHQK